MRIVLPQKIQEQFNNLGFFDQAIIKNKTHRIYRFIEDANTTNDLLKITSDIENISIRYETVTQNKELKLSYDIPEKAIIFTLCFNRYELCIIVDGSTCTWAYLLPEKHGIRR